MLDEREMRLNDAWITKSPSEDQTLFGYCEGCGEEVYIGNEYYRTDFGICHHDEDCLDMLAENVLEPIVRIAGEN